LHLKRGLWSGLLEKKTQVPFNNQSVNPSMFALDIIAYHDTTDGG
jgi:hypothetical protein